MTRVEEAVLAFIGTAECQNEPWNAANYTDDAKVQALLAEGMAEVEGDTLVVSIKGWRFLDARTYPAQ